MYHKTRKILQPRIHHTQENTSSPTQGQKTNNVSHTNQGSNHHPSQYERQGQLRHNRPHTNTTQHTDVYNKRLQRNTKGHYPRLPNTQHQNRPTRNQHPRQSNQDLSKAIQHRHLRPTLHTTRQPTHSTHRYTKVQTTQDIVHPQQQPTTLLPHRHPHQATSTPPQQRTLLQGLQALHQHRTPRTQQEKVCKRQNPQEPRQRAPRSVRPPRMGAAKGHTGAPRRTLTTLVQLYTHTRGSRSSTQQLVHN